MMRTGWVLVAIVLLALAPGVRADPAVTQSGPGSALAQWTFSNPANYSLSNAILGAGGASLGWLSGSLVDTNAPDFGQALTRTNLDLGSQTGAVRIADTSMQGPVQTVDMSNSPSAVADNTLQVAQSDTNYGGDPDLVVGFWGANVWSRSIVQFPLSSLPSNATVRWATLSLYMHAAATNDAMTIGVYRITSPWTEFGSSWDLEYGVTEWNSTLNGTGGGDFDPGAVDAVSGVTDVPGWYLWNVTTVVESWWSGANPNQGLLLRQVDDEASNPLGQKFFNSSDSTNVTSRPRLTITFTTPSSVGVLESRSFDAGGQGFWGTIDWNATLPLGTSIEIRTRTGNSPVPDGTWSGWSVAYPTSGQPLVSPPSRYLEYRARLFTPNSQSPSLLDVGVGFVRHLAAGSVTTDSFAPAGVVAWGVLSMTASRPANTDATLAYSVDGGSSWIPVASGADLSSAPIGTIRLRLSLTTANTTDSPLVASMALSFTTSAAVAGFFGVPYWVPLLSLLAIPIWLMARRALRIPFHPTDAFLILEDGRLVAHTGHGEGALRDELATSGMLTVVARFVKDSFTAGSGRPGELRSLQVDDRHVSIAKDAFLYLAIVSTGERPRTLPDSMTGFLATLREAHGPTLAAWDGFRESVVDVEARLKTFLDGLARKARRSPNSHA
ncbi:MAG TPA: DNRLRE domain-containing protein [Thermoplasmata archaeon]|nr:DNRLRE domain-containing protein [Thermoplasmata archaeon]